MDYTRHGIELCRRSESELAAIFNAELSRAVRYDAKRSETAQKIISMHKRHGEVVSRVLEQKVRENAATLIRRSLDDTSLLALAIGQGHLGQQSPRPAEASIGGPVRPTSPVELGATLASIDQTLKTFLAKFGGLSTPPSKEKKKRMPAKRDTVIFAAILLELKGMRYCSFLQEHGIKPKPSDTGHTTYPLSYQAGDPWRKRVQDEKTRAKMRMQGYARSELATAFNTYLPKEFDRISPLLA